MTSDTVKKRRVIFRGRIARMRNLLGISAWPTHQTEALIDRLAMIDGEGVTDYDLRVIVRLYNRELIGRRKHGQ